MFLNNLPDDCLLTIFNLIDNFNDLINVSEVCFRWNQLIQYRLANVKYLLETESTLSCDSKSTVYWDGEIKKPIKLNESFSNLKIVEIGDEFENVGANKKFLKKHKSINGLIYRKNYYIKSIAQKFPNLEIVVLNRMDPHLNRREATIKLKQIYVHDTSLHEIAKIASNLKNLQRLHLYDNECYNGLYEGLMIPSLKILELKTTSYGGHDNYTGFHFIDFCPSLQSAFFYYDTHYYYVNESIKNENLRDLVLQHPYSDYGQRWDSLRILLIKFPNLENLAIRTSDGISDENIKELVEILPKVKLLDFRDSPSITSKSADYLRRYCARSGRSIVIYYNCEATEQEDWPKIIETRNQIVSGFDFMTHCFFRKFFSLPLILYPNDESL